MKEDMRNFSGIFQVDTRKIAIIIFWAILAILNLVVISFGIWAINVDLYDFGSNLISHFPQIIMVVFLTIVLPCIMLLFVFRGMRIKPGVYLEGVRVTHQCIELGTLTLDIDPSEMKGELEIRQFDKTVAGEWKAKKKIDKKDVDIEILFRNKRDQDNIISFERIKILFGKNCQKQFVGKNINENVTQDIVTVHKGSFYLLEDLDNMNFIRLIDFFNVFNDIFSSDRRTHFPFCTVKINSKPLGPNNSLATGVLGGISNFRVTDVNSKKISLENIFNSDDRNVLMQFILEKQWDLLIES